MLVVMLRYVLLMKACLTASCNRIYDHCHEYKSNRIGMRAIMFFLMIFFSITLRIRTKRRKTKKSKKGAKKGTDEQRCLGLTNCYVYKLYNDKGRGHGQGQVKERALT